MDGQVGGRQAASHQTTYTCDVRGWRRSKCMSGSHGSAVNAGKLAPADEEEARRSVSGIARAPASHEGETSAITPRQLPVKPMFFIDSSCDIKHRRVRLALSLVSATCEHCYPAALFWQRPTFPRACMHTPPPPTFVATPSTTFAIQCKYVPCVAYAASSARCIVFICALC